MKKLSHFTSIIGISLLTTTLCSGASVPSEEAGASVLPGMSIVAGSANQPMNAGASDAVGKAVQEKDINKYLKYLGYEFNKVFGCYTKAMLFLEQEITHCILPGTADKPLAILQDDNIMDLIQKRIESGENVGSLPSSDQITRLVYQGNRTKSERRRAKGMTPSQVLFTHVGNDDNTKYYNYQEAQKCLERNPEDCEAKKAAQEQIDAVVRFGVDCLNKNGNDPHFIIGFDGKIYMFVPPYMSCALPGIGTMEEMRIWTKAWIAGQENSKIVVSFMFANFAHDAIDEKGNKIIRGDHISEQQILAVQNILKVMCRADPENPISDLVSYSGIKGLSQQIPASIAFLKEKFGQYISQHSERDASTAE